MRTATRRQQTEPRATQDGEWQLDSVLEPETMARFLNNYLVHHFRARVEPIDRDQEPRDAIEARAEVAVTASRPGRLGFGNWALSAYVTSHDGGSSLTLRALSGKARSHSVNDWHSTASLAHSIKKLESLALIFQALDTATRMQRIGFR